MSYFQKSMNNDAFLKLLNENCGCEEVGDGIEVLMQNLAKIHEYSGEVLACLHNENPMDLEDWIEDKVSKASQMMGDVKHYLEYRQSGYGMQQHGIERVDNIDGGSPMPLGRPEMSPPSSMVGGYEGGIMNDVAPEEESIGIVISSEEEPEPEMVYGEDDMVSDLGGSSFDDEAEEMGPEEPEEPEEMEEIDESIESGYHQHPQNEASAFSLKDALLE